jgi:hypothetical protein
MGACATWMACPRRWHTPDHVFQGIVVGGMQVGCVCQVDGIHQTMVFSEVWLGACPRRWHTPDHGFQGIVVRAPRFCKKSWLPQGLTPQGGVTHAVHNATGSCPTREWVPRGASILQKSWLIQQPQTGYLGKRRWPGKNGCRGNSKHTLQSAKSCEIHDPYRASQAIQSCSRVRISRRHTLSSLGTQYK